MEKDDNCCKDKTQDKNDCCVNAKIDVEKNIMSVVKSTSSGRLPAAYDSLIINYEIVLRNRSPAKITNLRITDSLWGIGITGSDEIETTVTADTCCPNIVTNTGDVIISSCGELIDPTRSSLDGCSSCTILVALAFRPIRLLGTQAQSFNIPYVLDTITVSGKLASSKHCNACRAEASIIPIFAKSLAYEDDSLFINLESGALGGLCNYRLCIPYTNTRCNQITCPRPRPR